MVLLPVFKMIDIVRRQEPVAFAVSTELMTVHTFLDEVAAETLTRAPFGTDSPNFFASTVPEDLEPFLSVHNFSGTPPEVGAVERASPGTVVVGAERDVVD